MIMVNLLQDPNGNRIEQWQSFKLERGLKQLSFPLSLEPPEGSYKVVLWTETGRTVEHTFSVEEFGMNHGIMAFRAETSRAHSLSLFRFLLFPMDGFGLGVESLCLSPMGHQFFVNKISFSVVVCSNTE